MDDVPVPLIVVFLRGGADALSWVAPVDDSEYIKHRDSTTVPKPSAGDRRWLDPARGLALPEAAVSTGHSFLGTILDLKTPFDEGHLTLVSGAGLPCTDPAACRILKSHFEAMDFLERGTSPTDPAPAQDGWLKRMLEATPKPSSVRAITHGALQVRSLTSASASIAVADVADYPFPGNPGTQGLREPYLTQVSTLAPPLYTNAVDGSVAGQKLLSQINQVNHVTGAGSGASFGLGLIRPSYPSSSFGEALRKTANILKQGPALTSPSALRPEVIHIDYGGWDHHNEQVTNLPTNKPLKESHFYWMARDLSHALGAFYVDMGRAGGAHKYHVAVVSEFGRRVIENGSEGTDHGTGGIAMFMGRGIAQGMQGGKVLWPSYDPVTELTAASAATTGSGVDLDLATTVDIRSLLAEVLHESIGVPSDRVYGNTGAMPPISPLFPTITQPSGHDLVGPV